VKLFACLATQTPHKEIAEFAKEAYKHSEPAVTVGKLAAT
jgi:hypothetical protein